MTLETLERRNLLAAAVTVAWDTEISFDQFSGGDAKVFAVGYKDDGTEDPELLGFDFCRAASCGGSPFSIGGIGTGLFGDQYGAEATFEVSGRLGLEYGVFANAGSADLVYDGTFGFQISDDGTGPISIDTDITLAAGGLFTQSPTLRAFVDLVLVIEGKLTGKGCFIDCTNEGTLDFTVDERIQLVGLNRGANGSVEFISTSLLEDAMGVFDQLSNARDQVQQSNRDKFKAERDVARARTSDELAQANQDESAAEQEANRGRQSESEIKDRVKNNSKGKKFGGGEIIQVSIGEDPSDLLGIELEVGVGVGFKEVIDISKRLGSFSVTVPDIALTDTTLDSDGGLSAKTVQDDARRNIAKLNLDLGAILGGGFGLGTTAIELGPLGLEVTTVSYDLDTLLRVNQEVEAKPKEKLRFDFTDPDSGQSVPVDLTVNGVVSDDVTSIEFSDGDNVLVTPSGSRRVLVTPTLLPTFRFTNDIGLDLDVTGTLRALAVKLTAFGQDLIDTDPVLERTNPIGQFDFGSIFDTAFDVSGNAILFEPFEIGGATSDLTVSNTFRPKDPSAGSGLLANLEPGVFEINVFNRGPENATGVTSTTTIPSELMIDPASLDAGCTIANNTLTCTASELASGSSLTFEFEATPKVFRSEALQLTTTVVSAARELDPFDNRTTLEFTVARSQVIFVDAFSDNLSENMRGCPTAQGQRCTIRAAVESANANPGPDVITLRAGFYSLESPLEITESVDILAFPGTTLGVDTEVLLFVDQKDDRLVIRIPAPNGDLPGLTARELADIINTKPTLIGSFPFQTLSLTAEVSEGDGSGTIDFGNETSLRFAGAFVGGNEVPSGSFDPNGANNGLTLRLEDPDDIQEFGGLFDGLDVELVQYDPGRFRLLEFGGSGENLYRLRGLTLAEGNATLGDSANGLGGAIRMSDPDDSLVLKNMVIRDNFAIRGGAVAITGGGNATFINTLLTDNLASKFGGAIHVENSSVTFDGTSLIDNSAGQEGGALDVAAVRGGRSEAIVVDSQFIGNSAPAAAGINSVTEDDGSFSRVTVERSVFARNIGGRNVEAFAFEGTAEIVSLGFNLDDDGSGNLNQLADRSQVDVISITSNSIAELTPAAEVGTIVVNAPSVDSLRSFAVDDDRFEVIAGLLKLKPGVSLDASTTPNVNLTVAARDQSGRIYTQPLTLVVRRTPTVPGAFSVTPTSPTSAVFSWTDSSRETEYRLFEIDAAGSVQLVAVLPADTVQFEFTNLPILATTTYLLEASNVAGSMRTELVNLALPVPLPAAPHDLLVDIRSPTMVSLHWQAAQFADGYSVFQDDRSIAVLDSVTTTLSVTSLAPDTEHSFFVRSENAAGSADSTTSVIQTPPVAPTQPDQFRVTVLAPRQVRLDWTPAARAQEHRVFQSTDGGAFVQIASLAANASTFSVDPLSAGSRNEFQVRAINTTGSAGTFGLEGVFDVAASVDRIFVDAADQDVDAAEFGNNTFPDLRLVVIRGDRSATLIVDPQTVVDLTQANDTLSVQADLPHKISLNGSYVIADSEFEDGLFFRVVVSGDAKVRINRPDHFQNLISRFDVNGSGDTSSLDALRIINFLARNGSDLPIPDQNTDRGANFVDVNGDLMASALDALQVINFLARQRLTSAAGEAIPVVTPIRAEMRTEARSPNDWYGSIQPNQRNDAATDLPVSFEEWPTSSAEPSPFILSTDETALEQATVDLVWADLEQTFDHLIGRWRFH